jgi:hypothetical protein
VTATASAFVDTGTAQFFALPALSRPATERAGDGRRARREETSAYDVSKATATVSNRFASRCPWICRKNVRMATNIRRGRSLHYTMLPLLGWAFPP